MTFSIDARAARWGDRTAIVDVAETDRFAPAGTIDDDRLTYGELATLSSRLADSLANRGIDAGETVAFLSRNRIAAIAILFACERLGATFAPISHRLTPVSVEAPLSLLDPAAVVAESAQRDLVRSFDGDRTVALESLFDAGGGSVDAGADTADGPTASDDRKGQDDGGETPLLALHGSDGTPIATYASATVEANCLAAVLTWGLGPTDRTILLRPLSRPDGLLCVALPVLYAGGRLALDRAFDPADAAMAIRAHSVTHLAGTATEYRSILASDGGAAALDVVDRAVISGQVDSELLETVDSCAGTVRRSFGWLGCPNALASERVAGGAERDRNAVAEARVIGRPFLDVDARLVADGTVVTGTGVGDLSVSGPPVADDVYADRGARGGEQDASRRSADHSPGDERAASRTDDSQRTPGRGDSRSLPWRRTGTRFRCDERGRYALEAPGDAAGTQ